jgi:hypothetical protein
MKAMSRQTCSCQQGCLDKLQIICVKMDDNFQQLGSIYQIWKQGLK